MQNEPAASRKGDKRENAGKEILMEFIVGGKAQGKLDYVLKKYGLTEEQVCDGAVCTPEELAAAPAVNHFHEFIRRFPESRPLFRRDAAVICDEVGCGVVPVNAEERFWRDAVGRAGCRAAAEADSVVRIVCGIAIPLK